jgi:hypothetical protein
MLEAPDQVLGDVEAPTREGAEAPAELVGVSDFLSAGCGSNLVACGRTKRVKQPMKASVPRLEILHESLFAQPAFQLAQSAPTVLKIFYDQISPRYKVPDEHMSVGASNTLSDLVIRMGLFDNSATLEVRPRKMLLMFPNITKKEHVQIIKDVITLAYDARQKAMPDVATGNSRFLLHAWLAVEEGKDAAHRALAKSAAPTSTIDPRSLGAEQVTHYVKMRITNETENWDMLVSEEVSAILDAHLFVSIDTWFGPSTKYATVSQKFEFIEQILPKIVLSSLNIEL